MQVMAFVEPEITARVSEELMMKEEKQNEEQMHDSVRLHTAVFVS